MGLAEDDGACLAQSGDGAGVSSGIDVGERAGAQTSREASDVEDVLDSYRNAGQRSCQWLLRRCERAPVIITSGYFLKSSGVEVALCGGSV